MQRAIRKKNTPGNLIIILYQLSKFEAPSCNGFWDTKFTITKFAMGDNSTNFFFFFLNFHQVIYTLSAISFASLKLLAVKFFLNIMITKFHYDHQEGT